MTIDVDSVLRRQGAMAGLPLHLRRSFGDPNEVWLWDGPDPDAQESSLLLP